MLEMVLLFNPKCGRKTLPTAVVNINFTKSLRNLICRFPLKSSPPCFLYSFIA